MSYIIVNRHSDAVIASYDTPPAPPVWDSCMSNAVEFATEDDAIAFVAASASGQDSRGIEKGVYLVKVPSHDVSEFVAFLRDPGNRIRFLWGSEIEKAVAAKKVKT